VEKRVHKITFYHPKIEKLAQCLEEGYLVGGFIRDRLLRVKKDYLDVDLVVKEVKEKQINCIRRKLKAEPFRFKKAKEVVSFSGKGWRVDLSEMEGSSIEEDLKKRDFTVNAVAVDIRELSLPFNDDVLLIDPTGGYEDLLKGVIRPTHKESLKEDPIRILRGVRLKLTLDFTYSKDFIPLSREASYLIEEVPRERTGEEIKKVAGTEFFWKALRDLDAAGALFPTFKELKGIEKIPPSGLHQYDLKEHSIKTVYFLEEFALKEVRELFKEFFTEVEEKKECLKLVALYHDVGKPLTVKEVDGRLTFYNHDKVGAEITKRGLIELGFGKECGKLGYYVVRNHLRPFFLYELYRKGGLSERAVYRFFKDTKSYSFHTLTLSIADFMATSEEMEKSVLDYLDFLAYLKNFYLERLKELKPLLTGKEIMEIKGISQPNKVVGKIKEKLLELQVLKKVNTKEEAVKFVKGFNFEDTTKGKLDNNEGNRAS